MATLAELEAQAKAAMPTREDFFSNVTGTGNNPTSQVIYDAATGSTTPNYTPPPNVYAGEPTFTGYGTGGFNVGGVNPTAGDNVQTSGTVIGPAIDVALSDPNINMDSVFDLLTTTPQGQFDTIFGGMAGSGAEGAIVDGVPVGGQQGLLQGQYGGNPYAAAAQIGQDYQTISQNNPLGLTQEGLGTLAASNPVVQELMNQNYFTPTTTPDPTLASMLTASTDFTANNPFQNQPQTTPQSAVGQTVDPITGMPFVTPPTGYDPGGIGSTPVFGTGYNPMLPTV